MEHVPAGSILGPRMFLLYVYDLPNVLKYGFTEMYADDSNFVFVGNKNNLSQLEDTINYDMKKCSTMY